MDSRTRLLAGIALLVVGTVVVFGLVTTDRMLLAALAAVVSVVALTAGTLLTGTTEEQV